MANSELDNQRKRAWIEAKEAVRAYARNPTVSAAAKVEACWQAIRLCNGAVDRQASDPFSLLDYQPRRNPVVRDAIRRGTADGAPAKVPETGEQPWPVNDIVMRSLLLKGMRDSEIAAIFHVSTEVVKQRRRTLDI